MGHPNSFFVADMVSAGDGIFGFESKRWGDMFLIHSKRWGDMFLIHRKLWGTMANLLFREHKKPARRKAERVLQSIV